MAGKEPAEVTVQISGRDLVAGTLWIHERGGQTATFRYADAYLASPDSYALDPALPKSSGLFHTPPGKAMFNAFADSAPDRWGENLMRRAERERARAAAATPRALSSADFLLGVRDDVRQGAIRFRQPGTSNYYSQHEHAVPRLIELPKLLRAVDHLDAEDQTNRDLADRRVLIVDRFDRRDAGRIGFTSALTMLEASDGDQRSYLEIAEAIELHSPRPAADLRELYRRVIFSILTANADDHLRNHAFLRERRGWALSPAYDLNPNPHSTGRLATAIDLDDPTASVETALSLCRYFRLSSADAQTLVANIERATANWRQEAIALGLPRQQLDLMSDAYENPQRQIARALPEN